jgi:hypothetical protein
MMLIWTYLDFREENEVVELTPLDLTRGWFE